MLELYENYGPGNETKSVFTSESNFSSLLVFHPLRAEHHIASYQRSSNSSSEHVNRFNLWFWQIFMAYFFALSFWGWKLSWKFFNEVLTTWDVKIGAVAIHLAWHAFPIYAAKYLWLILAYLLEWQFKVKQDDLRRMSSSENSDNAQRNFLASNFDIEIEIIWAFRAIILFISISLTNKYALDYLVSYFVWVVGLPRRCQLICFNQNS